MTIRCGSGTSYLILAAPQSDTNETMRDITTNFPQVELYFITYTTSNKQDIRSSFRTIRFRQSFQV